MISSPDTVLAERFSTIKKRWPTGVWDAYGKPRGRTWIEDLRRASYVISFTCLGTAGILELSLALRYLKVHPSFLFMIDLLPQGMGLRSLGWLAPLLLLNAWLLDGFLRDQARTSRPVAPRFRILRATVLAIPIFGLLGVPVGAWIEARHPEWVFGTSPRPSGSVPSFLSGLNRRLERWRRRGAGSFPALVLWICAGQLLGFNLLQSLVTGEGTAAEFLAWSALCHLASCVAVGLYLETRRVRSCLVGTARWQLWGAAALILLPMPFPLLSLALWYHLTEEAREEKTLNFLAVVARQRMPPLARPKSLEGWRLGASRLSFGSAASSLDSSPGRREERRQSLYRAKSFWGALDAAALVLVLALFGLSANTMVLGFKPFYLFYAVAFVGIAGEAVALARRILAWFRREPLPPYLGMWYFLVVTQIAVAMGYYLGLIWVEGARQPIVYLLALLGIGCCAVSLFVGLVGQILGLPGHRTSNLAFWMAIFVGLIVLSFVLKRWSHGDTLFSFLKQILHAAPLVSLYLGWRFLPVLLDPFTTQDLSDKTLQDSVRRRLRFMAVTALLPLGGLCVPLWIYLRQHLPALYEEHRAGGRRL